MPNLLAMCFEGELAPSFDLRCLHPGRRPPDGWGLGYYPGGEPSAAVLKEPAPPPGSIRSELIKAWESLASSLFVLHIRTATWGSNTDANTQPFERTWGGRHWLLAHSGSLRDRLATAPGALFEPVGSTDTERVFCELLNRAVERSWRSIGEMEPEALRQWFVDLNEHGSMTTVLTDGRDLVVYADREEHGGVYVWEIRPPHGTVAFGDDDLEVDLSRRGTKARKGVIVCSEELTAGAGSDVKAQWHKVPPGHLLIIRQGVVTHSVGPAGEETVQARPLAARSSHLQLPVRAEVRRYRVRHRTEYRYEQPVERSAHLLRLEPTHDRTQRLIESQIKLSVEGRWSDFDDVFGNRARRIELETPYTELIIEATSRVECLDTDALTRNILGAPTGIPPVLMPWQRHMLVPYLLPPELPETQLAELIEYATSFAARSDYDLIDTLVDLNGTIHREYKYIQGATNLATTPFEVYANRHGVCQDFTNLFICLARLLGVPARYTCGYIYTGPKNPNQIQSEASHAWVQVYLPGIGWKGFDPTNGILTQTEHVRVSVGRNYVDATPTSGTIYVGGGTETLKVDVRVEREE
jgi:transglutaminase-like putative cysteine protease/predicted glutamine amidotransferase